MIFFSYFKFSWSQIFYQYLFWILFVFIKCFFWAAKHVNYTLNEKPNLKLMRNSISNPIWLNLYCSLTVSAWTEPQLSSSLLSFVWMIWFFLSNMLLGHNQGRWNSVHRFKSQRSFVHPFLARSFVLCSLIHLIVFFNSSFILFFIQSFLHSFVYPFICWFLEISR